MKRTKETFHQTQPNYVDLNGLSGCRDFEGEDLEYDSRTQYLKHQQKNWLEQQSNEKEMMRQREKLEEDLYATQVREMTRMRQMLEEDFKHKKHSMQCSIKDENLLLAQQKRDREAMEKQVRLLQEREEVALVQERGKSKPYRAGF